MRRVGMVLAVAALGVALVPSLASGDWSADQLPADQEIWHYDGSSACPEVFFIGLRGSGQNGAQAGSIEFGDQIELLYRAYSTQIHDAPIPGSAVGIRTAPVPPPGYRAVLAIEWVDLEDPFGEYWASVDEGAAAIVRTVKKASKRCGPDTRFVLAGFSQGAQAVTESLSLIPERLRPRVSAALLVASPTWRGDQAIEYFGHDPAWNGSLADSCEGSCGGVIEPWAVPSTAALCHEGDAICTGEGFLPLHANYTAGHMAELAAWAVARTSVERPIPACGGRRATHVGTTRSDKIKGTAFADVVVAHGGHDSITTFGGEDRVCAGDGNDVIATGSGKDRIWAGRGADDVNAGTGNDWIWGEAGADGVLFGGGGDDVIRGGGAADILDGGNGHDRLIGGSGVDVCRGGAGNDDLAGCESSVGGS